MLLVCRVMRIGYGRAQTAWPLRLNLLAVMILSIIILAGMVSATTVPGVKLHALEMWGDSANKDVFSKASADSYRDFHKYALRALSDAGYLDHLLNDLPSGTALREMNSHGAATGLAMAIAIAGAAGAAANAAVTRTGAKESANEEESLSTLPTIDDIKALSLVKRMQL